MKQKKRPWNKGVRYGPRAEWKPPEVQSIQKYLAKQPKWRNLCIFMVGIDSYLRICDLVSISVADVTFANGNVRKRLSIPQKKSRRRKRKSFWKLLFFWERPELTTGAPAHVILSEQTRYVLKVWIEQSGKTRRDYLFTPFKGKEGKHPHITTDGLRKQIKRWVEAVGLNPEEYSGHSLRKSRVPALLEESKARGKDKRVGTIALGHKDPRSIDHYEKEQDVNEALEISASINFFVPLSKLKEWNRDEKYSEIDALYKSKIDFSPPKSTK